MELFGQKKNDICMAPAKYCQRAFQKECKEYQQQCTQILVWYKSNCGFYIVELCCLTLEYILKKMWLCYTSF